MKKKEEMQYILYFEQIYSWFYLYTADCFASWYRIGIRLSQDSSGGTFDYQILPHFSLVHKFRSHVFLRAVSLSPRLFLGSTDATETGTKPGDIAAADRSYGLICLRLKYTSR